MPVHSADPSADPSADVSAGASVDAGPAIVGRPRGRHRAVGGTRRGDGALAHRRDLTHRRDLPRRRGGRPPLVAVLAGALVVAVLVPVLLQVLRPGPAAGSGAASGGASGGVRTAGPADGASPPDGSDPADEGDDEGDVDGADDPGARVTTLPPWRSGATIGLGAAVPDPPATSPVLPRPDLTVVYAAVDQPLGAAELDRRAGGATLLLTLEPYDFAVAQARDGGGAVAGTGAGTDQPAYRLARIADGAWDEELRRWAREVAAARSPVMVRFAHEMNGTWYPWGEGVNGNRPGDYVAAWRHVVDLFREQGATDALWVWSPNVVEPGTTPLDGLWPGRDHVDVVGLDGYNWGTVREDTAWRSPARVFDATLDQVRELAPGVPVVITETASAEQGGDKAAWVRSLFAWAREREVAAVVWFAYDKETDWRPDSSPRSERAFREGAGTLS